MNFYISLKNSFKDEVHDDELMMFSFGEEQTKAFVDVLSEHIKIIDDYGKITFCQLVIVEGLLNNIKDASILVPKVLTTIYRPKTESVFDNENKEREDELEKMYNDMHAGSAIYLYNRFMSLRDDFINKRYSGVIYGRKADTDDENQDNNASSGNDPESSFNKFFFWYERQRSIAKELNMKMSDVLLMSANDAMFEIAYQVNKNKLEEYRRNKNEKK